MARIRTIKPEFFRNGGLYRAEKDSGFPLRVAFAGLWTCCDREGRFKWKPDELKLDCLPHDQIDFDQVLVVLEKIDAIRSYEFAGKRYGYIPTWHEHQAINNREAPSVIPAPPDQQNPTNASGTPDRRVDDASSREDDASGTRQGNGEAEGKGREGKGREGEGASTSDAASPSSDGAFTLSAPSGKTKVVGGNPVTLKTFFARCEEANEEPIPPTDGVFEYAAKAGIPEEFIGLCWKEFKRKHIDRPKKYANWRMAFRNCVESNWYKLWTLDGATDQYVLTGAGRTAQRVHGKKP